MQLHNSPGKCATPTKTPPKSTEPPAFAPTMPRPFIYDIRCRARHSIKLFPIVRHEIFGQFLSLIAGAGSQHTGVKPEDFTEEMMVSLPMDNYDDLKASKQARRQISLPAEQLLSSLAVQSGPEVCGLSV